MKVSDLIKALEGMPPDANVGTMHDGIGANGVDLVWLSKGGNVVMSGFGEPVYDDEDRPLTAPSEAEDSAWYTPDKLTETTR